MAPVSMNQRYAATHDRITRDIANALSLTGKRLAGLSNAQYYFCGERDWADAGDIEWTCIEAPSVSMYLLSNGESVGADLLPLSVPASFEIEAGSMCTWEKEDLLVILSAVHLRGKRMTKVDRLVNTWPRTGRYLAGFRVTLETGDFIVFYNRGDEAAVLINKLPDTVEGVQSDWVE